MQMPSLPKAPTAPAADSATATAPAEGSDGTPIRKLRLGEWLTQLGLISPSQLERALAKQGESGKRIGEILVEENLLTEKELSETLALQEILGNKSSLTDFPIDGGVLKLVPENFARQNVVIPLVKVGKRLVIAIAKQDDLKVLDKLSLLTGLRVVQVTFRKSDIEAAFTYFYENKELQQKGTIERAVQRTTGDLNPQAGNTSSAVQIDIPTGDGDAPIIELVNNILNDAVAKGASDVHIEPRETAVDVRFRMDGVLAKMLEVPKSIEASISARFKVLANLNITERRRPQDGRFAVQTKGEKVDFRISIIPTHWGEKIVLRLLRQKTILLGLDKLGFEGDDLEKLNRLLSAPAGMMLVTGPTGSGKTSTLYAALGRMDKVSESIITIEDPVEYPVDGISQVQANSKIGFTFASALRTILRQDPDTVMLGEIRDLETLETAIEASMTGHMVLSTLHTNDAVSTINRMIDMGVPPYMVSANVNGVVAQRLLRRVCSQCKTLYEAAPQERFFLGVPQDQPCVLAKANGCDACQGTGYKGQFGVFEIFVMSKRVQGMINKGETVLAITEVARQEGMRTLLEDGKRKAYKQMTTIKEVIRMLGLGNG